ncbi:hypothetical protein CDAR_39781 [Caerostris darwini]|uniref:Uncharacterized protein n=1 Tax=Caerostris darwini TaxID=1538125 RepID=A0AAV4U6H0_9ARAC|nr:hypothetical protein CDAR_39781 [Caerostris darwini]
MAKVAAFRMPKPQMVASSESLVQRDNGVFSFFVGSPKKMPTSMLCFAITKPKVKKNKVAYKEVSNR